MPNDSVFSLESLSPNIREVNVSEFFESRGFKADEFDVTMIRVPGKPVCAMVTIFYPISYLEFIKKVGTDKPVVEAGKQAVLKPWTGAKRRISIPRPNMQEEDREQKAREAADLLIIQEATNTQKTCQMPQYQLQMMQMPQQQVQTPQQQSDDHYVTLITSLTNVIQQQSEILKKQGEVIRNLANQK